MGESQWVRWSANSGPSRVQDSGNLEFRLLLSPHPGYAGVDSHFPGPGRLEASGIMARTLDNLFHYLDGLTGRASLTDLRARLANLNVECDDVAGFLRFSDRGYTRNLMRAGPWYHLLVLCWKNGQRSPIHDHATSRRGNSVWASVRLMTARATTSRAKMPSRRPASRNRSGGSALPRAPVVVGPLNGERSA